MIIQSIIFFSCLFVCLYFFYKAIITEEKQDKYYYITLPSNHDYELPDGPYFARIRDDFFENFREVKE